MKKITLLILLFSGNVYAVSAPQIGLMVGLNYSNYSWNSSASGNKISIKEPRETL